MNYEMKALACYLFIYINNSVAYITALSLKKIGITIKARIFNKFEVHIFFGYVMVCLLYCVYFSMSVRLLSQETQDNMYKPATQAIDWLQTYFKGQGSHKELVPPEICTHIGKEGKHVIGSYSSHSNDL